MRKLLMFIGFMLVAGIVYADGPWPVRWTTPFAYANKTSSGTSGIITGATTGSIVVADNVTHWSFKLSGTDGTYETITPSIWGTAISLTDGESDSEDLEIPAPVTFTYSLQATSTMTYTIRTLK